MFACIYCFFPLFFHVDPETTSDATVTDYVTDDPPSCPSNSAGPPIDHPDIAHSISLMLALDFATVIVCSYSDA